MIDGPLANALVCLDKNGNGACDSGEPSGRTDATGSTTLAVDNADLGKFPLVAVVGTDAVDAVTGAVTTAYTLVAPADQSAVVSPLTTLVQRQMALTGSSSSEAEALLRKQAGLSVSLFSNYSAAPSGDAANAAAASLARMLVLSTQKQVSIVAGAVGQPDASGDSATAADVAATIQLRNLGLLPQFAATVASPAVTGASNPDAALATAVTSIVSAQTDVTVAGTLQQIGVDKLTAAALASTSTVPTAIADGSLRAFRFTDASNWAYRALLSTIADATPDASGWRRYYDLHAQDTAGTVTQWGFGSSASSKDDLHWSGTAWVGCALGVRSRVLWLDAAGITRDADTCDGYARTITTRSRTDISGRKLADIATAIRAFSGGDSGMSYASWGPADLSLYGAATFPSGSVLSYQTATDTVPRAPSYTPSPSSQLSVYAADVAAGGDTRSGTVACAQVTAANFASLQAPAGSLDQVIGISRGTPCIYPAVTDANGTSGSRYENWSYSTVSMGSVAGAATQPAGTGNFFTTTASLRVAFAAGGNGVTYYRCLIRTTVATIANCDPIGTGTYTVSVLGDARLLEFQNVPALFTQQSFQRVLVERGGVVYLGYRNPVTIARTVNLNLAAANAVFTQLGLPPLVPN